MLIYFVMGGKVYGCGGWAKYVRELSNYLVDCNCRVKILCRMGKMYTSVNENSTNFHFQTASTLYFRRGFYVLVQHLPNPLSVFLGVIRLVKDIRSEGECQKILHVHDLGSSLLIAFLMKKFFRLSFVVQIHGFPLKEQYIKLTSAKSPLSDFIWILTKMWHNIVINFIRASSAPVLVNNSEVKSFYESYGVSSDKLKIVSSAVNLQKHEEMLLTAANAETCLGIKGKNGVTIGYVGGLKPEKNVETLITAFKDFLKNNPEVKATLVIIGDGPMKVLLEGAVKKYNLSGHVLFTGFIPDAYRFLNAIDIFVLPSLSEGSPLALIEAMAAGKAIIASNIPAIREIVRHGEEAILVNPYSVEELKQAILLLYNNPDLRAKLGHKAKERAKLYDVNKVYGEILKVYEELVRRKAKITLP